MHSKFDKIRKLLFYNGFSNLDKIEFLKVEPGVGITFKDADDTEWFLKYLNPDTKEVIINKNETTDETTTDEEIKNTKVSIASKKPQGWALRLQFVDLDGTVYFKGVEQPELKGTLPPSVTKTKNVEY